MSQHVWLEQDSPNPALQRQSVDGGLGGSSPRIHRRASMTARIQPLGDATGQVGLKFPPSAGF